MDILLKASNHPSSWTRDTRHHHRYRPPCISNVARDEAISKAVYYATLRGPLRSFCRQHERTCGPSPISPKRAVELGIFATSWIQKQCSSRTRKLMADYDNWAPKPWYASICRVHHTSGSGPSNHHTSCSLCAAESTSFQLRMFLTPVTTVWIELRVCYWAKLIDTGRFRRLQITALIKLSETARGGRQAKIVCMR